MSLLIPMDNKNAFDTPSLARTYSDIWYEPAYDDVDRLQVADDGFLVQFQYTYMLNLLVTPDMEAYLAETAFSDDVYALPIHLQRLLVEAKEEVVLDKRTKGDRCKNPEPSTTSSTPTATAMAEHPALERLKRVRAFCWLRSDADIANLMSTLVELVADDDELDRVIS
ncbi:hypothetical protein BC940DRAFT_317018 [Gongronella butleri]|nr:hypothetical protein BC940DRAFT_317018 [Gongronella butleri]